MLHNMCCLIRGNVLVCSRRAQRAACKGASGQARVGSGRGLTAAFAFTCGKQVSEQHRCADCDMRFLARPDGEEARVRTACQITTWPEMELGHVAACKLERRWIEFCTGRQVPAPTQPRLLASSPQQCRIFCVLTRRLWQNAMAMQDHARSMQESCKNHARIFQAPQPKRSRETQGLTRSMG